MYTKNKARSPGQFLMALKLLQEGLQTQLPAAVTQLGAGGTISSIPDLLEEVKGYVTAYQAAEDLATSHTTAIQAREALAPTAITRYDAIKAAIKSTLGKNSPNLPKFGVTPNKIPTPLTPAQKQVTAAKARATRVARRTMGSRQRAAIHGDAPVAAGPVAASAAAGSTNTGA